MLSYLQVDDMVTGSAPARSLVVRKCVCELEYQSKERVRTICRAICVRVDASAAMNERGNVFNSVCVRVLHERMR